MLYSLPSTAGSSNCGLAQKPLANISKEYGSKPDQHKSFDDTAHSSPHEEGKGEPSHDSGYSKQHSSVCSSHYLLDDSDSSECSSHLRSSRPWEHNRESEQSCRAAHNSNGCSPSPFLLIRQKDSLCQRMALEEQKRSMMLMLILPEAIHLQHIAEMKTNIQNLFFPMTSRACHNRSLSQDHHLPKKKNA